MIVSYKKQNRKFHCLKRNDSFKDATNEFATLKSMLKDPRLERIEAIPCLKLLHTYLSLTHEYGQRALSGIQTGTLPTYSQDAEIGYLVEETLAVPLSLELQKSVGYLIHHLENEMELVAYQHKISKLMSPDSKEGFVSSIIAMIEENFASESKDLENFVYSLNSRFHILDQLYQLVILKQNFNSVF
jgi:hypothetical protein